MISMGRPLGDQVPRSRTVGLLLVDFWRTVQCFDVLGRRSVAAGTTPAASTCIIGKPPWRRSNCLARRKHHPRAHCFPTITIVAARNSPPEKLPRRYPSFSSPASLTARPASRQDIGPRPAKHTVGGPEKGLAVHGGCKW